MEIKEPTSEQCESHEKVFESDGKVGFAIWYPQMGGYVGKAVAILDKEWKELGDGGRVGGCIDLLIWHDGEFPFIGAEGSPREIHHCDPSQFIRFGEALVGLNANGNQ